MDAAALSQQIQDEVRKAVTQSTYSFTPSDRSIYSPENLDPVVKTVVPTATPVRSFLPRVSGMGEAASFNKLVSKVDPTAEGTGTRVGFADAGQPSQTTQDYTFVSYPYKNLGRDVEIGRQQIAANKGSNLEDVRAREELIKTTEVLLGEEVMTLTGDAALYSTEYSGFSKLITTNSGTAGLITASGVSNYAQTLFQNGSDLVSHLVLNPRQNRALSDQLEGSGSIQRIVIDNQGAATGGTHLKNIVDGNTGNLISVVTSRYAASWAFLLSVRSAAGQNWIEMEDLETLSIYDVPTANHSIQSRVFETTVLKVIGEPYQYKIGGLATS